MISKLIDELRQMADGQATYRDARAVMLQAADTIWQLRDDLQRANAAVQDAEHDESMAWDRVRKAEADNAKLRDGANAMRQLYEDELKHALAENAKLRESLEYANNEWEKESMEYLSTQVENAKLRELVDYMTPIALYGASEQERDRMRELGVDA